MKIGRKKVLRDVRIASDAMESILLDNVFKAPDTLAHYFQFNLCKPYFCQFRFNTYYCFTPSCRHLPRNYCLTPHSMRLRRL